MKSGSGSASRAKKLSLVEWLLSVRDKKILQKISKIKEESDEFDLLDETTKAEIETSLKQLDKGKRIKHSVLFKEIRKDLRL